MNFDSKINDHLIQFSFTVVKRRKKKKGGGGGSREELKH